MKFLVNSTSPNMVIVPDFDFRYHSINYDEYKALRKGAINCLAQEDICDILGEEVNPTSVNARPGDVFIEVKLSKGVLSFYCVQVTEPSSPLLRSEETEMEA